MTTVFRDRQGRQHAAEKHFMTFIGKHNANVVKVLLTLANAPSPLTLRQLSKLSSCPYESLSARLGFWFAIRYIERSQVVPPAGKAYYTYSLGDRGLKVLVNRIPEDIKSKCIAEINAHRRSLKSPSGIR